MADFTPGSSAVISECNSERIIKICQSLPKLAQTSTKATMDPEGAACLLRLGHAYGKPRLCINIHHYAPPIGQLQRHWLEHVSKVPVSSFKSIA